MTCMRIYPFVRAFASFGALTYASEVYAGEVQVVVTEPAEARVLSSTSAQESALIALPANQPVSIDISYPVSVTSPTRVPIILVPIHGEHSLLRLDSQKLEKVVNRLTDQALDQALSETLSQLSDIENLIRQKKYTEAKAFLQKVEGVHPEAKFFEFTRASLLLLEGNRDEALKTAEAALKSIPEYREGQEFVRKLKKDTP